MYCGNCGEQIDDNAAVCVKCGVKVGTVNRFCKNCGNPLADTATYCTNCGSAAKDTNRLGNYDKITMIIVCIFLGALGIHCFMLGEVKKGVLRIILSCCCGIGEIIALIDLIRICTDNYTVDPNGFF